MRVIDILKEEMVIPELENNAKREILRELSQRLAIREPHVDVDNLVATLLKREDLGTTAIGEGIAIPHGKIGDLNRITAVFGIKHGGVDCDSLDGKPTKLFFLFVAPEDSAGVHLKALARVSRLLKNPTFREQLLLTQSQAALYKLISEEDSKL